MIQKISFKFAINTMLIISGIVIPFHLLVVAGTIPFNIVWGGRLKTAHEMLIFEAISIAVNAFIILLIFIKGRYFKNLQPGKFTTGIFWILTILFSLNTLGNIFSSSTIEAIIFSPLTFFSALMCYRIAIEDSLSERQAC